jgi:hypothetical protein
MWLTLYNDSRCAPIGQSVELDTDPRQWLGEPHSRTGSLSTWYVGAIVIVLSSQELTP